MLSQEIRNILNEFKNLSPQEAALKLSGKDLPLTFIIQQIEGRQKAREKLPTWHNTENIIFPVRLSIEQCSSEQAADYKASILKAGPIIDLTGGFGVDSFYFSKTNNTVTYIEQNTALFEITKENFKTLLAHNLNCINGNGMEILAKSKDAYQTVFIDPARRDLIGKKVFQLSDCEPNVIENLDLLLSKSKHILIKTAPLLDIDKTISDLKFVKEVHVVAINNECKEVLYLIENEWPDEPTIIAVNILKTEKEFFRLNRSGEKNANVSFSVPSQFIYEPNFAILKTGAFKSVASQFKLNKISQNTHLYTSDEVKNDFQGRIFKVLLIGKENEIKKMIVNNKANIITRNYSITAEELKKKLKIRDGGDQYILGFKDVNSKPLLALCERLK